MTFDRGAAYPADQTTVRRANLGVVLRHVASSGSRSRAQIAAETGLTRGTVSSLVSELIERDLLHETGETTTRAASAGPGRRSSSRDVVVGVGLEVNVDYLAVSVEDLTGDGALPAPRRIATTATRLRASCSTARTGGARRARRRRGRGAAAGRRHRRRRRASSRRRPARSCSRRTWAGPTCPSPPSSSRGSGCRSVVENEANLAALAEHWTGAAVGIDDFVCVFGEVGVGGGIVLGGRLFRGTHGFGGEFGHISDRPGWPSLRLWQPRVRRDARRSGVDRTGRRHLPRGRPPAEPDRRARPSRAGRATPAVLTALDDAGRWLGYRAGVGRSTSSTSGPSCSAAASARSRRGSRTASARRSRSARSPRGRDRSPSFRLRSATAPRSAAPRRSRCGGCSTRRGLVADVVSRAKTDTDPRPRATGAERRWGSGTAESSTTVFEGVRATEYRLARRHCKKEETSEEIRHRSRSGSSGRRPCGRRRACGERETRRRPFRRACCCRTRSRRVRWETQDRPTFIAAFKKAGVPATVVNAEGDAQRMRSQADQCLANGAKVDPA